MLMTDIFEKFVEKAPTAVMARASLEYALEPTAIDALFGEHAERQYHRKLLFSTMLDVMALVVCRIQPSVHAAFKAMRKEIPVSIAALYEKLAGVEPATTGALVAHSAARLRPVIEEMGAGDPWLPGYRVRVVDGNHLASTERRLEVLRQCSAGPLPGLALAVIEPEMGLVVQMVGCEDGHAQERSLLDPIIEGANAGDVYIADRNFCTRGFLDGLVSRGAFPVIRQHAKLPIASSGTMRSRGRTDTGNVYEQPITVSLGDRELRLRRIIITLDTRTRDGDTEMAIVTNLPSEVDALTIVELYRRRWTIESLFQRIEHNLEGEISGLGYPRAALFAFGVALVASNAYAVVHAAMEAAKRGHRNPKVAQIPLSDFAIVMAARSASEGMEIVLGDGAWYEFHPMPPRVFAKALVRWGKNCDWERFRKAIRGPKKPTPKRTRHMDKPHVSTARLLAQ